MARIVESIFDMVKPLAVPISMCYLEIYSMPAEAMSKSQSQSETSSPSPPPSEELFELAVAEADQLDHEALIMQKLGHEPRESAAFAGAGGTGEDGSPSTGDPAPGAADTGVSPPEEHDDEELFSEHVERIGGLVPLGSVQEIVGGESQEQRDFTPPARALARADSRVLRELEKGHRQVGARLDLHHLTAAQALEALESFIVRCWSEGARLLLVITGRGLGSEHGPVVKPEVQRWLITRGGIWVLWAAEAPPRLGGQGALVIKLRKRRPEPDVDRE